jgi:hypothetical protein
MFRDDTFICAGILPVSYTAGIFFKTVSLHHSAVLKFSRSAIPAATPFCEPALLLTL